MKAHEKVILTAVLSNGELKSIKCDTTNDLGREIILNHLKSYPGVLEMLKEAGEDFETDYILCYFNNIDNGSIRVIGPDLHHDNDNVCHICL